ncbi:hypothetical protein MKJ04_21995 [Pontibacter sp. E15-1]|uniref:hypothetical protein n=1 Tax=Pontibacter sp. E15-1 TaxID=2919918 RepID=UPI001F4F3DFA|nr:hypothetical protein [Pontibacter sp. E15-1]MCJ8167530.1 hypothetical protein [Pontibacter sp. E15-1]
MKGAKILIYQLSTGLLGRKRTLRLSPEYLEYENKEFEASRFTRVSKEDVLDIKHSMSWIIWYRFYVGCDFRIDIRTRENGILKIRFFSYFSQNSASQKAYDTITDYMWDFYFKDIVEDYRQEFAAKQELRVCGVWLTAEGAYFAADGQLTAWPDVAVKEYEEYFALYNKHDPELNKIIEFDEWESHILFSVLSQYEERSQEE